MAHGQLIGSYVHMRGKPREQHALFMLRKIASMVKPIMIQRGFKVGCLAEFWPEQQNLLGLNIDAGRQICIRLRQPYDDATFLDIDSCIYTMLHELTHNIHGPHDHKFHTLLKSLEDEYALLLSTGYTGEGFYSPGHKLGTAPGHKLGGPSHSHPPVLPPIKTTGHKLGGAPPATSYTDLRARAAAAATRRARISKTCSATSTPAERASLQSAAEAAISRGFRTREEEDEANEAAILRAAVELIEEGEREEEMQRRAWVERGGVVWIMDDDGPPSYEEALRWDCDVCTLINTAEATSCEACGARRPEDGDDDDVVIVEAPRRRSGGLKRAASGKMKQRVRFGPDTIL